MSTFVFTMTCPYVGESYDVTLDGKDLGWVRLRHSKFVARNTGGQALLTVEFDESGLYRCFYPDIAMRDAYLMLTAEIYAQTLGLTDEVFAEVDNYFDYEAEIADDAVYYAQFADPAFKYLTAETVADRVGL